MSIVLLMLASVISQITIVPLRSAAILRCIYVAAFIVVGVVVLAWGLRRGGVAARVVMAIAILYGVAVIADVVIRTAVLMGLYGL